MTRGRRLRSLQALWDAGAAHEPSQARVVDGVRPDRRDHWTGGHRSARGHDRPAERSPHCRRPGRSTDHGRHASERPALLPSRQQAAGAACRAAAGRERGLDPGRRRSARAGALRGAHVLQRDAQLSEAGCRGVPAVDRHAVRRAHQRQHQLRPDGVPADDSHRRCQENAVSTATGDAVGRQAGRALPIRRISTRGFRLRARAKTRPRDLRRIPPAPHLRPARDQGPAAPAPRMATRRWAPET